MPNRRIIAIVILSLALAACGDVTSEIESLPTLAPTILPSVEELPMPDIASGNALRSGHLAFIGVDNNVYVLSSGKPDAQRLTDNAVPVFGGQGREYHDPTWSQNGWLSYVSTEVSNNEFLHTIYAVRPSRNPPGTQVLYQSSDTTYIYGYWSPAQCAVGIFCARFSYMMSHPDEIELRMAEVHSDSLNVISERLLGRGQPFYISWAPDGTRMIWFRAGQTLEVYSLDETQPSYILPDTPALFQAPAWSPVDDRILFAQDYEGTGQVVVADPASNARTVLTQGGAELSAFAWSPDGQRVVIAEAFEPAPYYLEKLTVVSADGQTVMPITEGEVILAFFWSPDSKSIAYFTIQNIGSEESASLSSDVESAPPPQGAETVLELNVANLETGESYPLSRFFPTRSQLYLFQFFDQFAQSHTIWSPDSSQIVFAELLPDGREIIRVVNADDPQASSITIAEGSFAVFSFHN